MDQDLYSQFISKTRYARYLPEKNRRENWPETVERYMQFMVEHLKTKHNYNLDSKLYTRLYNAIVNMDVMPSMRALMSAGKALERDNTAGYNCSYLPIEDPKCFDEAMLILLCGTGVGFSVERQYINKLPEIPDNVYESDTKIIVKDSKEGWAKAFRQLIALLYSGEVPKYDLSKLRPAGARLKTFGGRSSGPAPLDDLFKFTIRTFKNAAGRKLTSLECHDIMCKIGEIVVVGGVRRAALISFSNLSDDRMRHAKSGAWWESNMQRALSNNSAAYTEKPEIGLFMKEWLSLYESKSGERGMFNIEAAKKQVLKNGRRDVKHDFKSNPCFTGNTLVAVADGRNAVSIKELSEQNVEFLVYSARPRKNKKGWKAEIKSAKAFKTGVKNVIKVLLSNGTSFECTPDHRLALFDGDYVEAKDSIGQHISRFYTTNEKYRTINSYTNGHSRQYRMIWEYKNGAAPIGYHIDHKFNNDSDYIENLQLLKESVHNKKSAKEHIGRLNPVFKIKDVQNWKNKQSKSTFMSENPNYSGVSDQEIISYGKELLARNEKITVTNLKKINPNTPSTFSKNRFGGKIKNLRNICNGLVEYSEPVFNKKITENKEIRDLSEFVTVIDIINENKVTDVYDLTVEDNHNFYIINSGSDGYNISEGVLVHNCNEIILRPYQFCNLTEVVARSEDTEQDLLEKVEIASILGTIQSTLTNFPYLRKIWEKNTAEERLLGVSITGIYDNVLLNNILDVSLPNRLETLKQKAVETNKKFAELLGIEQSTAITCVKPSGNVSQLVDAASGIHPRFDKYYFRRVRNDNKDKITGALIASGVHHEPDVTKPDNISVFTFAKKAPEGALTRNEISSIDHLELWMLYQNHWCEHKPSVTISVKEEDWMEVGAWVYRNFDDLSGVSFLPYDGGSYRQAPYETCTKEQYDELLAKTPKSIDWDSIIEVEDNTEGSQQLACSSGSCEL